MIEFATTIAPGRARRAAHRQGLRGGQAATGAARTPGSTTPSCSTRRRPAGSRSSSTSTASSPDSPRWARSSRQADNVMRLLRSPAHRGAPGHGARGDAGPGDRATGSTELRPTGCPVGGVVVNLVRPQDLDADGARGCSTATRSTAGALAAGPQGGRASRPTTRWWTGLLEEARDHAERRGLEDSQRELVEALDVPTYELPRMPGGVDLGALYELAAALKRPGHGMTPGPAHRLARQLAAVAVHGARASTSTRCSTTPTPGSSSAAAPAASARPRPRRRWRSGRPSAAARSSCSPSTRPAGWPSRWGSSELDNTPRPVAGDRRRGGRQPRRDDARHEAHLRRGRGEPGHARRRRSRSWRTPSTSRSRARSRARRSTWRWRSSGRSTRTPRRSGALGPDRGRHPAVAVGAGLPGRPGAALQLPRRPLHPAAAGPGTRAGPADDGRASG